MSASDYTVNSDDEDALSQESFNTKKQPAADGAPAAAPEAAPAAAPEAAPAAAA